MMSRRKRADAWLAGKTANHRLERIKDVTAVRAATQIVAHQASMSRRGNCFDNAQIESFWGTLKGELVYHRRLATRDEARRAISKYIEMFYNRQHMQARLDYLSPVAFTQRYYLNQVAA